MNKMRQKLAARWVRAAGPVVPIALFGAVWIVLHATSRRGGTHTLFQVLALAECTIALLLRGRKPVAALAGIVVAYALADLDTIMILPVLLAVATVADRRGRSTAAAATLMTALIVVAMPFLHGDQVSVLTGALPHLAAVVLAAGLGAWVRAHRHPVITAPAGPDGVAAAA
jgi:K+ transporter